ncbi:MAG TPA: sigma-70 family RNA polymerase sigma factor, partial [Nocardioidaceae bacterium]|nr:sigma-70 family RNA polymerase sigma factor [Nocardioidaceae bacterium]
MQADQHVATSEADKESTVTQWAQIVEEHSPRVYRLAYRLTGNKHDAEDLTQEVFIRVFRSLDSFVPGSFEGWLHRITTNLFLDRVRRRQKFRFDGFAEGAEERFAGSDPSPEYALHDANLDPDVEQA